MAVKKISLFGKDMKDKSIVKIATID